MLIQPEPAVGWRDLVQFRRLVVNGKLLGVIGKEQLHLPLRAVMDNIHKARFAQFDEHLELVARFERHVLSDGDLLGDIPFGHEGLKSPEKIDVVSLLCLRPDYAWQLRLQQAQAQHRPENHDPSTRMHKVISDK